MLFVKLLLAHLLGDFVFQPGSWVIAKENKKLRAWQLYVHVMIHGVLMMLLVGDVRFLFPAAIIALSHGLIDGAKLLFQKESNKRAWFITDQFLHLLVLLVVWFVIVDPSLVFQFSTENLIVITALVFITTPVSVIIKTLISQWAPLPGGTNADSLQNAGKFIGILERLMVFTFVLTHHWEAIGFLIAAKSVFRFGDLKDARDLKLTEYVLIGTLLSFGIALAAGLWVDTLIHAG